MQDGVLRQPRTWWIDKAVMLAGNVKKDVECFCSDWKLLRTALMKVLSRFPDAQAAVLEKLEELSPGGLRPLPAE